MGIILQKIYDPASFDSLVKSHDEILTDTFRNVVEHKVVPWKPKFENP